MKLILENWRSFLKEGDRVAPGGGVARQSQSGDVDRIKAPLNIYGDISQPGDVDRIKAVDIYGDIKPWWSDIPEPYRFEGIVSRYIKVVNLPFSLWVNQDPRALSAVGTKKRIEDILDVGGVGGQIDKKFQNFYKSADRFEWHKFGDGSAAQRRGLERFRLDIQIENKPIHQSIVLYFLNETQFIINLLSLVRGIKTSGENICYDKKQIKGVEIANLWKGGCIKDHELKRIILKELDDIQRGIEKYARYPRYTMKKKAVKTGVFGLPAIKVKAR